MPAKPDRPARWKRVEELFHAALDRPAESRSSFLEQACASDPGVQREVESLIRASASSDGLLEEPVMAHMGLAQSPWTPGMTFGHYVILGALGAGGMGEVFRARDTRLDREVALKTIPPDLALDPSYVERLRREARSLASLNHPNIATLYEIEEAHGQFALAMELLDGDTLDKRLARSRLPIADALSIAMNIARAVEAAHRKGVIHRDLKPGNIMLTRAGLVKVLDFGLAKRRGPLESHEATGSQALTSSGAVLGTPGYMSPEQTEGADVDGRSDIFSFGAILYEMVAGAPAFGGDTAAGKLASVLRDEPPPLENGAPEASKQLSRIVKRCLSKNAHERYQNITDVRFALEDLITEPERDSAPKVQFTRRRVLNGAALAAGGAAVTYGALRFGRSESPPLVVTPLTMFEGFAEGPALSPDRKMVAFTWGGERQDNIDLYLIAIGSTDPLRLTSNPAPERRPLWSPDGRFIAFSRLTDTTNFSGLSETIFAVPVLGGNERVIGRGFATDWSPDASSLLARVANRNGPTVLALVSAYDGSSRPLTETPAGSTLERGRFSPDGRRVYFIEQTGPADSHLKEMDISGGAPRRVLIEGMRSVDAFAFVSPDELVFSGRTEASAVHRFYRVAASGGVPRPLPFGGRGAGFDTFPGAGALVYSHLQWSENVWRVGAWPGSERQPRKWIASDAPSLTPAISPAGDRIAFSSYRSGGNWNIWISDADGNGAVPAARFPNGATTMVGSPAWSPDGRQIAFDAYVGTYPSIYITAVDAGLPRLLTPDRARNIIPQWSRDGRWIYYTSNASGSQRIWRVPSDGGEPRQITTQGGYSAKISHDGKHLYYLKSRGGGELWRASAEGGEEEMLVRDFKSRNFWALPEGVYMLDPGVSELSPMSRARARFYRFSTGKVEDLGFQTDKPVNHYGICLSHDGKWLYYTQADRSGANIMLVENFR